MQRTLIFPVFLILPLLAEAQDITVSAKVVDKETNEPLEYASVGLKSTAIGTITNSQGEFDFHMPAEYRNEIMVISNQQSCGHINSPDDWRPCSCRRANILSLFVFLGNFQQTVFAFKIIALSVSKYTLA